MNAISENKVKTKNYEKLAEELKNTLNFRLKDIFTHFFSKSDEIIFELASEAGSNEDQSALFELLHKIRTDKANISRGLTKAIKDHLTSIGDINLEKKNQPKLTIEDDDNELCLVSQESMEDLVLINSIASKIDDKFSNEIKLLEYRLEFLAKKTDTIFGKNALAPKNFCLSFQSSIDILEASVTDKKILYKLFENEVASNLNEIYAELNKILISADILPDIKLYSDSKKKHQNNPETPKDDPEIPHFTEAKNSHSEQQQQTTPSPNNAANINTNPQMYKTENSSSSVSGTNTITSTINEKKSHRSDTIREQEINLFEDTITTLPSPAVITEQSLSNLHSSHAGHSAQQNPSSKAIAGYPAEETNRIINNFIGRGATVSGSENGNTQYYDHNDVLTALTEMQLNVQNNLENKATIITTDKLKHSLLETIASQNGGALTKQVSNEIEKTIDFIKLIFDAIIDDDSISDAVKALLLSLQIPVIKASMIDHDFFIDDNHPARQLLDKITELGVGVSTNTDSIFLTIQNIIKQLLVEYIEDLGAFVTARDNLQLIIDKLTAEAKTQENEEQAITQKSHARRVVLNALRKAVSNTHLPEHSHKLILTIWPTIMFNHFLKKGKENDEWIYLVTTLSNIVSSIQEPADHYQYIWLKKTHASILKEISSTIQKTRKYKNLVNDIFSQLQGIYRDTLKKSPYRKPCKNESASSIQETIDQKNQYLPTKEDIEANRKKETLQLLPEYVVPGAWFKLTTDENRTRRLKLSIIIIEEGMLVFVDHNGCRIIEKNATDFSKDINQKKAQLIMTHSIFDHALTSAVDIIKH